MPGGRRGGDSRWEAASQSAPEPAWPGWGLRLTAAARRLGATWGGGRRSDDANQTRRRGEGLLNHPPPSYRRQGRLPARGVAEVGVGARSGLDRAVPGRRRVAEVGIGAIADPDRALLGVLDVGRGSGLSCEREDR